MLSCKATRSPSDNPRARARLPSAPVTSWSRRETAAGRTPSKAGINQVWQRLLGQRQAAGINLVSTNHPVLQNPHEANNCKMLHNSVAQDRGVASVPRHYVTKTRMFPFALQRCRAQEIALSWSFCLPHPPGKAPKLVCAVLQQAVECFFRDLSLGQGSWVLQQWNSLSPWLATPLGTAPHLALTKANTHNSPKTNTGVTIQFCDYHSRVITTTLCWASTNTPPW